MAEAMGFELMDLLQSTVFKTDTKAAAGWRLEPTFLSETFHFPHLCRPYSIRVMHLVSELILPLSRRPAERTQPLFFKPFIRPLARQPSGSGLVSSFCQLSRSLISALKHVGKHQGGAGSCFACAGNTGSAAGFTG